MTFWQKVRLASSTAAARNRALLELEDYEAALLETARRRQIEAEQARRAVRLADLHAHRHSPIYHR